MSLKKRKKTFFRDESQAGGDVSRLLSSNIDKCVWIDVTVVTVAVSPSPLL